jgi:putative transposase
MEYESKAHAKYLLLNHLIFVCKYCKKLVLSSGEEVKKSFEEIAL